MLSLKTFRKKIKGFADLLKYGALVDESVILNKDGSLTTMYYFRGQDTASSIAFELNRISTQINCAMQSLGDGWILHVDAIRTADTFYPENNHFPDRISRLIDDERREFFQGATCYKTEQYMSLTWLPNYSADKLVASATGNKREQELEHILKYFENALKTFEDTISSVLTLSRLGSYQRVEDSGQLQVTVSYSEFLSILHYIVTGIFHPIRLPDCPMYLDGLLVTQDLVGGTTPQIGDKYISTVSIDGLPQESWPAMLSRLDHLPVEFRFNTRFIALDKATAMKELDNQRKSWNQKVYKFTQKIFPSENPKVNEDAFLMAEDAKEAMSALESDYVAFGYLSSTIIILNEDLELLEESSRNIRKILQAMGFGCRIESVNTLEAWLGSHPGNSFANLRRPLIHTLNLSHLLPLASVWHGRPTNPCPFYPSNSPCLSVFTTDGSAPFYFNTHVGDLGHTLITGTTGSGKSTLLALLAAQFRRYPQAKIYCFDKSNSMEPLCRALGGSHFDIGKSGSGLAFAPLQNINESEAELSWALDWIESLINLQIKDEKKHVTPKQRNFLVDAMKDLATQPENMRSLTHFYNIILSKDDKLAEVLKYYTIQGSMGHLLDASADSLSISDFMVFEIETLMNMGEKNLLPVLLYLFHRIENSLKGQPSVLILDEAWIMLAHPVFRAKISEWLRMLRKANCAVILATQQLTDLIKSDLVDVLIGSCPTKFFLPNLEASKNENLKIFYESMGLNERKIDIIANARPKREYYLESTEGSRLVNLQLGPKTLAFVGASDKDSLKLIRKLAKENPDGWQEAWLAIRNA